MPDPVRTARVADGVNAPETPLQQAERHVAEFEAVIARQEAIVAELARDGHAEAAGRGRQLLEAMRHTLHLGRDHVRLERERGGGE